MSAIGGGGRPLGERPFEQADIESHAVEERHRLGARAVVDAGVGAARDDLADMAAAIDARAVERAAELLLDRLHVLGPRQPHRVGERRPFTRRSREMVEDAGQHLDRLGHQPLVGHQPDLRGMPLGQGLIGDELLGVGRQRAVEQVVAQGNGSQRAAFERVVRRVLVVLAVAEVRHRLVERIAVDEHDRPAAAPAGGAFEGRHVDRRVAVCREIDRRVAVVHPLMEVVVARHMEGRSAPPTDVGGGEAGTHGVADEQMIVRQGAPHMEQRPTPEALEIEGWSRRLAKSPAQSGDHRCGRRDRDGTGRRLHNVRTRSRSEGPWRG